MDIDNSWARCRVTPEVEDLWRAVALRWSAIPVAGVVGGGSGLRSSGDNLVGVARASGEMADAHGSGPCVRKDVGVQLPPRPLWLRQTIKAPQQVSGAGPCSWSPRTPGCLRRRTRSRLHR